MVMVTSHQHRLVVVQMLHHVLTHLVTDQIGVPPTWLGRAGAASRQESPRRPARRSSSSSCGGRSDGSPSINHFTLRRGSTRASRPAILSIRTSNACCQRAGSPRWPAVTTEPRRLTPARIRRGSHNLCVTAACPARAPDPSRSGPGSPPGSKNKQRARRHNVGKTVKRAESIKEHQAQQG